MPFWSHATFHLVNQNTYMVVAADKSEVFFYCYLPALSCIDLFMRLYLFTCKRPMLNVYPETGQCLWRKGPVDSFK